MSRCLLQISSIAILCLIGTDSVVAQELDPFGTSPAVDDPFAVDADDDPFAVDAEGKPLATIIRPAGTLSIKNETNATIRIGCDYYINAYGKRVDVKSFWTFPPGYNGRLTTPKGEGIVSSEFVFFQITPEGESSGWKFDRVNKDGNLFGVLTASGLASHKKQAAQAKSGYPPLNNRDIDQINFEDEIVKGEKRLKELDYGILSLQAGVKLAEAQYEKFSNDTSVSSARKILAATSIASLKALLSNAVDEREMLKRKLERNRTELSQLRKKTN